MYKGRIRARAHTNPSAVGRNNTVYITQSYNNIVCDVRIIITLRRSV